MNAIIVRENDNEDMFNEKRDVNVLYKGLKVGWLSILDEDRLRDRNGNAVRRS